MTPERWQQIEALCQGVLDLPSAKRAAYLDTACAGDDELRREVESLLAAHDESFLEDPVARVASEADVELPEGSKVGPYRLIRPLGHGGMGLVYLAVRDDEAFTQHVAVKVIRRGLETEDILQRFRAERQILASLSHPNIARLFDGGATDDGRPYFVMEYVEGAPITQYCDAHRLSIDERLELFRQVCAGVHHAHQNLIVHRDLKPSNILVTQEGVPKLLDFGIAKLLNPTESGLTAPVTRSEMRLLTPEYASPEQVKGEVITTASDVYALGVLLYELLTGRRPYRLTSRTQAEIERVICEEEPTSPSTAITKVVERSSGEPVGQTVSPEAISHARRANVERLRRRLAGDLDNVILMAMRKEPARRYASAEQFSEDIRRHQEGLPVLARPDTLSYRAKKFVRRHRVGVVSASVIAVLLVASTTGMAIQSALIRQKAAEVERERDRAEEVRAFLIDLFRASDPAEARGDTITARELLDRGLRRIESGLADQPESRAEMLMVIGEVFEALGRYEEAEQAVRTAVDIREKSGKATSRSVVEARIRLGRVLREQGRFAEADTLLNEMLQMQLGVSPPQEIARMRTEWGSLLTEEGRYDDAERELRAATQIWESTTDPDASMGRIPTMISLASVLKQKGEYDEVESLYREALSIQRRELGDDHPEVAATLNNLAGLLNAKGDYDGAEAVYRENLAVRRKLLGDEHPDVAASMNNLADVLRKKGAYEEAETLYRQSLDLFREELGDGHPKVAALMNNLASVLDAEGKPDEAEALYREALALRRRELGDAHPNVASTLNNLGALLRKQRRYDEAEPLFREALAIYKELHGTEHPATATLLHNLASLKRDKGDDAAAEPLFREAVAVFRKLLGPDHPNVAIATTSLAGVLRNRGKLTEADTLYQTSLVVLRAKLPEGHPRTIDATLGLGLTRLDLGRPADAEPLLRDAVSKLSDRLGKDDPHTVEAEAALQRCLEALDEIAN